MKAMPGLGQRAGEALALGEEAVAGMDRLGAGRLAGVDDQFGVEIGFERAGGGPSRTLSSAICTCGARASASE